VSGEGGKETLVFVKKLSLSLFLLTFSHGPVPLSHTLPHCFSLYLSLPPSLTDFLSPSLSPSLLAPRPSHSTAVFSPLAFSHFEFGKCEVLVVLAIRLLISDFP